VIAAARLLVAPSPYESLSMAALEAWSLGRPVYYQDAAEFGAALDLLLNDDGTARTLGERGCEYFRRHYSWPVIERKYLDMFDELSRTKPAYAMEPVPGWLARRQRTIPPAAAVVDALPAGPAISAS
jgi:glycosyltransferase involved in cell wall biosynthesis